MCVCVCVYSQKSAVCTRPSERIMKTLLVLTRLRGRYFICRSNMYYYYVKTFEHSSFPLSLYSVCFNDDQNVAVLKILIKEVNASNPTFQAGLIRGEFYR